MKIILASASPRRRELLTQIGVNFAVQPACGAEVITGSNPEEVVKELSAQKAEEVAKMQQEGDWLVIGADTVVSCDSRILGKPKDEADAFVMLSMLQGHTHEVYTGVTLYWSVNGKEQKLTFAEQTKVTMYAMTAEEIRAYIKTGEPMDKAGSYGIQGKCAAFIEKISGDYNNVVGLPVARIYQELLQKGIDILHIS